MAQRRARVQAQSGLKTPIARAVARPVDTYSGPPRQNTLSQLAEGLATIQPSVARFSGVLMQRTAEQLHDEGVQAARRLHEEGLTMAKATLEGRLPKHQNPWFTAGLEEQFGRVSADTWQSDLMASMAASRDLQNATSMEAFDAHARKHRQEWLAKNVGEGRTGHFEAGFGSRADAYYADARRQFAARLEGRLGKLSTEAHFMEVKRGISQGMGAGAGPEVIAKDIQAVISAGVAQGRDPATLWQSTVEAVSAAALEADNIEDAEQALEVLKHIPGENGMLADSSFGSEAILKTTEAVLDREYRTAQRQEVIERRQRERRGRKVAQDVVAALMEDPYADLSPFVQAVQDDPEAIQRIRALPDAVTDLSYRTDQEVYDNLFSRIYVPDEALPVDERQIIDALARKDLRAADAQRLLSLLESVTARRERGGADDITSDKAFERELRNMGARFTNPMTGFIAGETADRKANAQALLYDSAYRNEAKLRAMSDAERSVWFADEATRIVEQQRGKDFGDYSPAPPPNFQTQRGDVTFPEELVLTEKDLYDFARGARISDRVHKILLEHKIPPSSAAEMFRRQLSLYQGKYGRAPQAPKPQKPAKKPGLWDRLTGSDVKTPEQVANESEE